MSRFTFSINIGPIRASIFFYFWVNKIEIEIYLFVSFDSMLSIFGSESIEDHSFIQF